MFFCCQSFIKTLVWLCEYYMFSNTSFNLQLFYKIHVIGKTASNDIQIARTIEMLKVSFKIWNHEIKRFQLLISEKHFTSIKFLYVCVFVCVCSSFCCILELFFPTQMQSPALTPEMYAKIVRLNCLMRILLMV